MSPAPDVDQKLGYLIKQVESLRKERGQWISKDESKRLGELPTVLEVLMAKIENILLRNGLEPEDSEMLIGPGDNIQIIVSTDPSTKVKETIRRLSERYRLYKYN